MADDTYYFAGILIFFIFLGVILPYVHSEFDESGTVTNPEHLVDDVQDVEIDSIASVVSLGDVAISILSMFFWTFGALPLLLDLLVFVPMRLILIWLAVRLARGV